MGLSSSVSNESSTFDMDLSCQQYCEPSGCQRADKPYWVTTTVQSPTVYFTMGALQRRYQQQFARLTWRSHQVCNLSPSSLLAARGQRPLVLEVPDVYTNIDARASVEYVRPLYLPLRPQRLHAGPLPQPVWPAGNPLSSWHQQVQPGAATPVAPSTAGAGSSARSAASYCSCSSTSTASSTSGTPAPGAFPEAHVQRTQQLRGPQQCYTFVEWGAAEQLQKQPLLQRQQQQCQSQPALRPGWVKIISSGRSGAAQEAGQLGSSYSGLASELDMSGTPEWTEWYPAGLASPTVYYSLRRKQLTYLQEHDYCGLATWRTAEESLSDGPSHLLAQRSAPSLTVLLPTKFTNLTSLEVADAKMLPGAILVPLKRRHPALAALTKAARMTAGVRSHDCQLVAGPAAPAAEGSSGSSRWGDVPSPRQQAGRGASHSAAPASTSKGTVGVEAMPSKRTLQLRGCRRLSARRPAWLPDPASPRQHKGQALITAAWGTGPCCSLSVARSAERKEGSKAALDSPLKLSGVAEGSPGDVGLSRASQPSWRQRHPLLANCWPGAVRLKRRNVATVA
ncbi:hypothetical protein N2152v2_008260 [Parachlorella kessleri]